MKNRMLYYAPFATAAGEFPHRIDVVHIVWKRLYDDNFDEVCGDWLEAHITEWRWTWIFSRRTILFKNESDAVWFKLACL